MVSVPCASARYSGVRHATPEAAPAISEVAIGGIGRLRLPAISLFCILANMILCDRPEQAGKIEVAKYIDPNVYLQKDADPNGK